ncbi:MAG: hypothetical protein GC156_02315 [Actinomycetales bacterium]|nr:hypothetical protein [Actinomycetales bacterium]
MRFGIRRDRAVTDTTPPLHHDHLISSRFDTGICRFVLECSCGDHFDTRYIDEALEYRELHETLAPLADQLG